ncbi:MAG: hypothetical protein WBO08_15425 [Mycobacterium sp.]
MNGLWLTRPSVRRAIGFIVATAVVVGVIAGLVLYANEIVVHSDPQPTPVGDYVRLFILDIVFWGPMALLAIWMVSVPVILILGLVTASVRRGPRN